MEKRELSICIIVKNDEKNLEHCLRMARKYPVQIVVVDTGSTDQSRTVAQKYADKVIDFIWCDDFARAKNFAIAQADSDMVLVLDSDEYLQELDMDDLLKQIEQHRDKVGRIKRINQVEPKSGLQESQEYINRIFSKNMFEYEGKIHEQVVKKSTDKREEYNTYLTTVTIMHNGYAGTKEERKKKAERNIVLLERELQECKDEKKRPYLLYQLGKGEQMAGNLQKACVYFEQALGYDLNPKLEYVIDMVESYGYVLLNTHQEKKALDLEGVYEEFGNTADFQFLMGLIYMNNEYFDLAEQEFLKATTQKNCRVLGTNSYLAYYNAGVINECLGNTQKAIKHYRACGAYKPAQKQLEKLNDL